MLWWTLQQLKSKDEKTRLQAVGKLAEQEGASISDALISALADSDKEVRKTAAKVLGKFGDPGAVRPLIAALADRDPDVRESVAESLKLLGDASAVPPLVRLLKDTEPGPRWHAASALEALGWRPANDTETALQFVAQGKADRCVALGEAAIDAIVIMLKGGVFFKRQQAVDALSRIGGPKVVKPLVDSLRDDEPIVRTAAVEALAKGGDARAVEPLLRTLRDKDNRVRATTVEALSRLGDAQAIDPLAKLLKDQCWDVRMAAIEAMGKFKEARAIDPLVLCLKDKDRDARQAAVMSLGRIGDPKVIEPLVVALTDENEGVRAAAAAALRKIDKEWEHSDGAHRAVPALQQLTKSTVYWIRQTATDTLAKIGEAVPVIPETLTAFADPVQARKQMALETLLAALSDSDRDLRQAAAESLGRMGEARATASLTVTLDDYDEWVRRAGAQALEALKWQPAEPGQKARLLVNLLKWDEAAALGAPAVEPLITALRGKTGAVREAAALALGKVGDARAVDPLVACVRDNFNYPSVRSAAAVALSALKWQPDTPELAAMQSVETGNWEKVVELGVVALPMLLEYAKDNRVDDERLKAALGALSRTSDPKAAGLLAGHAEDPQLAKSILAALEQMLAFKVTDVSAAHLRQILAITNPTSTSYRVDPKTGEYTPVQEEAVDFSLPRQMAEQELATRGQKS